MEIKLNMNGKTKSDSNPPTQNLKDVDHISLDDKAIEAIIRRGLIITGNIGCGKSVLAKYIVKRIRDVNNDVSIRVIDTTFNWRWNFSKHFEFFSINSNTLRAPIKEQILYDLDIDSTEERVNIIEMLIKPDYNDRRQIKRETGCKISPSVYVVEEANTILNVKTMKNFWLDFVSTCRNYDMSLISIMQRMSDSSTKVIERCPNFAFGVTKGQNDLRKIKGMTDKETIERVKSLNKYEFLMVLNDKIFTFRLPKDVYENKPCTEVSLND